MGAAGASYGWNGDHPTLPLAVTPREVTPAVLAESEPLDLTLNPTHRDTAALQSVTLDAPEGRRIYFRIGDGLTSTGGFVMASVHADIVSAPAYPKAATIALEGALLPLTGDRRLTLSARGVTAIKVEIQQLLPGALNHLASQTRGDIRNPSFESWTFDADNISSLTTRIVDVSPGHPRERVFAVLDLNPFLGKGGLFLVRVQGWDRQHKRTVGALDRRMALITDLGLLVKTNVDHSQQVFRALSGDRRAGGGGTGGTARQERFWRYYPQRRMRAGMPVSSLRATLSAAKNPSSFVAHYQGRHHLYALSA